IVVGSGPGGYVTAIRAAQLNLKTAIVERDRLGGICLNWGCIPTKALLRTSELYRTLQHLGDFALEAGREGFDISKVVERSGKVAGQLNRGVGHLMKKNKVTVIEGTGRVDGPGRLIVSKDGKQTGSYAAKHIILATGARARSLPGIEPDGELVWTYMEAM